MKALVQRVSAASVTVSGQTVSTIGPGLCVFVGVGTHDGEADAALLADRIACSRIFGDDDAKMNLAITTTGGSVLLVSQFTLMADTRRGRRPSFVAAARPETAEPLIQKVVDHLRARGLTVETGRFGEHMDIDIQADGPVTILLDTKESRSG